MCSSDLVFALTAAGAVVIGLALQDTLGNFFAGLAIQVEKPFRVGHWVRVAGTDARVQEVTWRATKLRTKTGNLVVVPNSALAKDTIVNYSEPSADTRLEVDISVGDDVPPNRVKATVLEGMRDVAGILGSPAPEVLLLDFGESAIAYRVRFWTTDFTADERLKDAVRTATYYAFNRAGIPIPSPVRMVVMKPEIGRAHV